LVTPVIMELSPRAVRAAVERDMIGVRMNDGRPPPEMKPITSRTVIVSLLVSVAVAAGSALLLLAIAEGVQDRTERAKIRIDAIKTAITVGAGTGGILALFFTGRRQWVSEREHIANTRNLELTQHDAIERRVTDLYAKASELLGQDSPVSRMAGLYALSRLGQANPAYRQTIVDLICGYLRLSPIGAGEAGGDPLGAARETEVRQTAQRVLKAQLALGGPDAEPLAVDLTGSTLHRLDLAGCRLGDASFAGARFQGGCVFSDALFGDVSFQDAAFDDVTVFTGAVFGGAAAFESARFVGDASFAGARFRRVDFVGGEFTNDCTFVEAVFADGVDFSHSRFHGSTNFRRTDFGVFGQFEKCVFHDYASFVQARCVDPLRMHRATFEAFADLGDDVPHELDGARVKPAGDDAAIPSIHVPRGWVLGPVLDGYRIFERAAPEG
jgi:uncharacterized protein YjbI with pentapeptide repeats